MDVKVIKRDGRIVDFDRQRIVNAISKAMKECGVENIEVADAISQDITEQMKTKRHGRLMPSRILLKTN